MGFGPYSSRRELLKSIAVLQSGSLLLPLNGQVSPGGAGLIRGALRDGITGRSVATKLRVTNSETGEAYMPAACIKTMPRKPRSGLRYFYASGAYEVAVPPGRYRIEAVRGICHEPQTAEVEVESAAVRVHDFSIRPLLDLHASGWYSGNTHTHYNVDIEESVDDRLHMVPPAEAVDVIDICIKNAIMRCRSLHLCPD